MKRPVFIIGSLVVIIIALSIVRVGVVNSMSTNGIDLVSLQSEVKEYKKTNALLKEQYLEASALTNIESKATQLGFAEVKTRLNLSAPQPLAIRN